MRLYTGFWAADALLLGVNAAFNAVIEVKGEDSISTSLKYCHSASLMMLVLSQACAEILILWTYLQFSRRIEDQLVTEAIGALQSAIG